MGKNNTVLIPIQVLNKEMVPLLNCFVFSLIKYIHGCCNILRKITYYQQSDIY